MPSDDDIPEPGEPPQPLEPEFEAALARFMALQKDKGFKRYLWNKGADDLIVTPQGVRLL